MECKLSARSVLGAAMEAAPGKADTVNGETFKMFRSIFATAVLTAGAAGVAVAHHSGVMFDRSEVRTIEGEVKEWSWGNPHSYLRITVAEESDEGVEWNFESTASAILARQGWRRTSFEPGEAVSVHYNPLRDGGVGGNLVGVTKSDGTVLGNAPE